MTQSEYPPRFLVLDIIKAAEKLGYSQDIVEDRSSHASHLLRHALDIIDEFAWDWQTRKLVIPGSPSPVRIQDVRAAHTTPILIADNSVIFELQERGTIRYPGKNAQTTAYQEVAVNVWIDGDPKKQATLYTINSRYSQKGSEGLGLEEYGEVESALDFIKPYLRPAVRHSSSTI